MPLLALFIPLKIAVPLSVLVSISVAGIVVVQDWKKIHFKSAGWLVLFTLLGTPIGLLLLIFGNEHFVKVGLGIFIIAFSIYSLLGKTPMKLIGKNKIWLFGCGFLAGIFGGAYGLNGPPLVLYGAMKRWSAQRFRATLQAYFLPASAIGMLGFWSAGLWTPVVTEYYLWNLPVILPAIFLGRKINSLLEGKKFFKYIYFGLIGIGVLLIVQIIR